MGNQGKDSSIRMLFFFSLGNVQSVWWPWKSVVEIVSYKHRSAFALSALKSLNQSGFFRGGVLSCLLYGTTGPPCQNSSRHTGNVQFVCPTGKGFSAPHNLSFSNESISAVSSDSLGLDHRRHPHYSVII